MLRLSQLCKAGLAEDVRRDEGLFATGLVACRYYDNEFARDAGREVEAMLMEGVDVETETGRFYQRERDEGRAVGGGSMEDDKAMAIMEKYPRQERNEVLPKKEIKEIIADVGKIGVEVDEEEVEKEEGKDEG